MDYIHIHVYHRYHCAVMLKQLKDKYFIMALKHKLCSNMDTEGLLLLKGILHISGLFA